MRKLGLEDVFYFSSILDKMQLDVDLNNYMDEAIKSDDPQSYIGGKMMMLFVKNIHKAKDEVYEWVSYLTDKSVDEVKSMGFVELKDVFVGIFQSEDITDFLNSLASKEKN